MAASEEKNDELLKAKKRAMLILQHNDRTEWELTDKLSKAGFSDEAVNEAVEYVRSFHYIDDERYAKRFVEIYHESRSIKRLRQDLYKRHVSEQYIELALENIDYGCIVWKELKPFYCHQYKSVSLSKKGVGKKNFYIHKLVYENFYGPYNTYWWKIYFKNGDVSNCSRDNLGLRFKFKRQKKIHRG